MDKLQIVGGKRLNGEIPVSGAKNAALPILCAGLLTSGDLELSNVPRLHDVRTMLRLLEQTGLKVDQDDENVTLNGANITSLEAPYELVKTMRASASLVIAGMAAEGTTLVDRIYHLDRGYDRMEVKLSAVGADIVRIK